MLTYLNSSFGQLQAEVRGKTTGGVALLELDVKPLSELQFSMKKLPGDVVGDLQSYLMSLRMRLGNWVV